MRHALNLAIKGTLHDKRHLAVQCFAGRCATQLDLAAYRYIARKRLGRTPPIDVKSLASKSWDIAPGETTVSPPAIYLPGQLERVTGWEGKRFYPYVHPARTMEGGISALQGPTRGYLIKDVWLVDGALYKGKASHWLSQKPNTFPRIVVDHEIDRAAIYCTQNGNSWFGTWLMEDCPTYALACNEGVPVTTAPSARYPLFTQAPAYEDWLDMQPLRLRSAFFRELVLFDDQSNNRSRHARYRAMGDKLLAHVAHAPHPGCSCCAAVMVTCACCATSWRLPSTCGLHGVFASSTRSSRMCLASSPPVPGPRW